MPIKNKYLSFGCPILLVGVLLCIIATLTFILIVDKNVYFMTIDINQWGLDSQKLLSCFKSNTWPCDEVTRFPLAYVFNSLALITLGVNTGINDKLFTILINIIFTALPILYIFLKRANNGIFISVLYVFSIFLSPLPAFYYYSGALEIQSGVVLGLFTGSFLSLLLSKKMQSVDLFFFVFSAFLVQLYKDTNIIVLALALTLTILIIEKQFIKKTRLVAIYFIIFLVVGFSISLSIIFNYLKLGTIFPVEYIKYGSVMPTPLRSLKYFFATLFSPNGGILVFWLSSFLSFFLLNKIFKFHISSVSVVAGILLIFSNLTLFCFWSGGGFGWAAWGARYMVPPCLGALVVLVLGTSIERNISLKNYFNLIMKFLSQQKTVMIVFLMLYELLSIRYLYISYISNKNSIYIYSLDGGNACIEMHKFFRAEENINLPLKDWYHLPIYTNCENERYLNFLKVIK